ASPRSLWVRVAPGIVVALFLLMIAATFSEVAENTVFHHIVLFSAPVIGFWILLLCRASVLAFRMLPLVLHTLLITLAYTGYIPVARLAPEFVCESTSDGIARPNRFGVARIFPRGTDRPGPSFAFLRKMVLSDEQAFLSYGPTCGIYSVGRE